MRRLLQHKLSSTKTDVTIAQFILWTCALMLMVGGIRKVAALSSSESELTTGILLVMTVTLLVIIGGLLLPVVTYVLLEKE